MYQADILHVFLWAHVVGLDYTLRLFLNSSRGVENVEGATIS